MELENFYARLDHPTKDQVFREMDEWCNSLERVQTLVHHPKYPLMMQWHPESAHFFSSVARQSLAHAKILFTSIPSTVTGFVFNEIFNRVSGEGMPFAKLCFAHPLAESLSYHCLREYACHGFDQYKLVVHTKKIKLTLSQWSSRALARKDAKHLREFLQARMGELNADALIKIAKSHGSLIFEYVIPKVAHVLASTLKKEDDVQAKISWKGVVDCLKLQEGVLYDFFVIVYERDFFELNRDEILRRIHIALKEQLPEDHFARSSINPSKTNLYSLPPDVLNLIAEIGDFGDLVRLSSTCKMLRQSLEKHVGALKTFVQSLPDADPRELMKPCLLSANFTRAALRANKQFFGGQLLRLVRANTLHASVVLPSSQVRSLEDRNTLLLFLVKKGYGPLVARHTWYAFGGYKLMQIAQGSVASARAILSNPKAKARLKPGHLIGTICASPDHAKAFSKEFLPQLGAELFTQLVRRQGGVVEETLADVFVGKKITNFYLFRRAILEQTEEGSLPRLFLKGIESLPPPSRRDWLTRVRRDRRVLALPNGGGEGSSWRPIDRRR